MTRRLWLTALLGVTVCALLATAPAAGSAAPAGWTVAQITPAASRSLFEDLCVSSDLVAMRTASIGPAEIWAWWPGKTVAGPVQGAAIVDLLAVSGDRAVWRQVNGGLRPLMIWKVGDAAATEFTHTPRDTAYPDISNERIAWLSTTPGERTILTQTVGESTPTTISAIDNGDKTGTRVSGGRVVWSGFDGLTWQIFTWAAGEPTASRITTGPEPHISPRVSGDRVVWMSQDSDGNGIVCTWKKGDPGPTTLGAGPYDGYPQVSGDRVVWTVGAPGDSQVRMWRAGETVRVTTGPHWITAVSISGDRLAWSDGVDGESQIVTWRDGESSLTTLAASASFLDAPLVGGDRVAWRALDGALYQVFTAAPTIPPAKVVPVVTRLTPPTVSPTRPTHGRTATFKSYLTPSRAAFASGAKGTLLLYRKERGHWILRTTVTMKRTAASAGRALLSAGAKPRYSGSWKAVVRFGGSAGYAAATSAARYFTVR